MSDADHIPQVAHDISNFQAIQKMAANKLLAYVGEIYPTDGCAITKSALFQAAGVNVDDIFKALLFDKATQRRNWQKVGLGSQKPRDIGTTCMDFARHCIDHVYLVQSVIDSNQMLIADNQKEIPHTRSIAGGSRSPTTYFLRAS